MHAWEHKFTFNLMPKLAGSFCTEENCHRARSMNTCSVWACSSRKYCLINKQEEDTRNQIYLLSVSLPGFLLSGCFLFLRSCVCPDVTSDINLSCDGLMLRDCYAYTFSPCDSSRENQTCWPMTSLALISFSVFSTKVYILWPLCWFKAIEKDIGSSICFSVFMVVTEVRSSVRSGIQTYLRLYQHTSNCTNVCRVYLTVGY